LVTIAVDHADDDELAVMYQLFLYVHICAVIWVGGAVYAQLLDCQAFVDPSELPHMARRRVGSRVSPAAVLCSSPGP
jgi:hypothetical protein